MDGRAGASRCLRMRLTCFGENASYCKDMLSGQKMKIFAKKSNIDIV
jgi:hypothetical protein